MGSDPPITMGVIGYSEVGHPGWRPVLALPSLDETVHPAICFVATYWGILDDGDHVSLPM